MITKLAGVLNRVLDEEVRLQVGPIEYQVLVPEFVRRQLHSQIGKEITLSTTQYLEGNQMSNRMVPRLVGFPGEVELEFFELFCTVDKIGVRKRSRRSIDRSKKLPTRSNGTMRSGSRRCRESDRRRPSKSSRRSIKK